MRRLCLICFSKKTENRKILMSKLFRTLDRDNTGWITEEEFTKIMRGKNDVAEEDVEEMLAGTFYVLFVPYMSCILQSTKEWKFSLSTLLLLMAKLLSYFIKVNYCYKPPRMNKELSLSPSLQLCFT